jgi:hypothetical protein
MTVLIQGKIIPRQADRTPKNARGKNCTGSRAPTLAIKHRLSAIRHSAHGIQTRAPKVSISGP